ncbi:HhH-GPD superfamily base excision DNA repair protein [Colletotrichum higginsianum]|uniref:HhH-GPD superfamily base excision DNA repair protein n=2 Tax=Colletotrichum higginsianum TaxID=80884 RepID=H1VER5_COLHI|nr:HhH-GPD superfamily base excision DNA repair protein [Colletotrichum higginsianum IMI 349063]OBR07185.1 HhH-GPD superfamily base excision DNA repair protein [Colletotrichum higginsianum IMI 349063]TIC92841.1 DNA-3-methyladenine glycosylase [Colletotrichum higginsianum]GJC98691.1 HhH-GPD superfamily base excision DNA repair protein [Colletotrichum higginsianum]CCF38718.1 HhH-GPD superfamily base excision DNA repair protein [Colletotrichum higginsianum]
MATRRSSRLSAQADTMMAPPPVAPVATKSRKRKSAAEPTLTDPVPSSDPVTPPRKRGPKVAPVTPIPPPITPTPSAVGIIAERVNRTAKAKVKAVNRLADPKLTNAPVISPETSRIIASHPAEDSSPSKAPAAASATGGGKHTTTSSILEEACRHLIQVEPRMKPLIEKNHCRVFSPEGLAEKIDPFESLCSGIISQQVSGAAARSIKNKFVALFTEDGSDGESKGFPHPSEVAAASIEHLRTAGLSQRKAEYVKGLAEKFVSGELSAQMLAESPYEEVRDRLIAVRGLGLWSVEMFACFGLKRMDVFSLGDLGVQRGMAAFAGRDVAKLKAKGGKWKYMSEKEMVEMASRFAPYRSVFMWYMWRVEETDISTLE